MSGSAYAAFALAVVVAAGIRTVAAVVVVVAVPFILPLLLAMFVRADVCVFLGVVSAGWALAYLWNEPGGEMFDFRGVFTVVVVSLLGLWCLGVWAGRRIRARRARLRLELDPDHDA